MKLFGVIDWEGEHVNLYQEENEKEAVDEFVRLRESGLEIGTILLFEYDLLENSKKNLVTCIDGRVVVHDKSYIELADKEDRPQATQAESREVTLQGLEKILIEGDRCGRH